MSIYSTLHNYAKQNNAIRRQLQTYMRAKQNAADFQRAADLFPDGVGNSCRGVNLGYVMDYQLHMRTTRAEIMKTLGTLDHLIDEKAHARSWRDEGHVWNMASLTIRKQTSKLLGREMAEAIQLEDGEYFIDKIWDQTGSNRDRRKLRGIWEEATGEELHQCQSCNNLFASDEDFTWVSDGSRNSDSEHWCQSCTDDSARYSDHMGEWIREGATIHYYDSYRAYEREDPDDYVTYHWASRQDDVYIADAPQGGSCAVPEHVWDDIRDDEDEPDVYQYHSGHRVGFIPTEYSKRKHQVYLGVELEFEFHENSDMHDAVRWVKDSGLGNTYGVMECDGSLTRGFEFITGYTGLDQHKDYLGKLLCTDGTLYQNARTGADTTGTHVHVTKQDMTWWHITKLAAWIYNPENRSFMERVAGRHIGGEYRTEVDYLYYAKEVGRRHAYAKNNGWGNAGARNEANGQCVDWSRYGALSVETSTGKTVEFRMFRGSIHLHEVLAWAEFAFASWHFSQQHGMSEMNVEQFVKFIYRADNRMDTVHLRKYLEDDKNHPLAIAEAAKYTPRKKPVPGEPEQLRIKLNGAKKRVV